MRSQYFYLLLFTCITAHLFAQNKKPLTHDAYDSWNSITERSVANDGKRVVYTLKPQDGDSKLMLHDISGKKERAESYERSEGGKISEDSRFLVFKIKPYLDTLKNQRRRKVKEEKLPKDTLAILDFQSPDTLVKIPRVKSYKMPEKGFGWVAFLSEPEEVGKAKKEIKDSTKTGKDSLVLDSLNKIKEKIKDDKTKTQPKKDDKTKEDKTKLNPKDKKEKETQKTEGKEEENELKEPEEPKVKTKLELAQEKITELEAEVEKFKKEKELAEAKKKEKKPKPPKKETKDSGTKLILRNLLTAKQDTFLFVTEYEFSKNASKLAFISTGNDTTFKAGVYVYDLEKQKLQTVLEKPGKHQRLAWDEAGEQLAFLSDLDTNKRHEKDLIKHFDLYYWAEKQKTANVLADRKSNGVPANYMINEHLQPYFAKDGSKLYFGTNPILAVPDTTLLPEEMVSVDVWHWQDAKLQSQQNVELANEKKRGYLAVVYPKLRKITQLGSPEIPTVITATEGNAEVCLGISTKPHERQSTWEGYPIASDIYLISTREGKPRRVKEKLKATNLRISPNAQYIAWYAPADTAWFAYSIRTGQIANLTKGVKTKFYDELFDMPDFPESYGDLGWTEGDQTFLVYDRYDIWALHPENKAPAQRITQNGRENKFEYRYVRLDPEEKFLKTDQVMFLRVFDEETKGSGYFTKKLNDSELPRKLTLGEYSYGNPLKAKQADRYVFSRETFQDFPDLYHTDINFVKVNRLSNANPQQANYWWGSVELVKWTAPSGEELHGLLYKPENFDEEKKYPMLTYFYERLSDGLYNYVRPEPSWSTIRASVYTSNGYVVFMPDIPYRTGQPGQSAYDAIMSGVSHVLGLGFVDKDKLGIHGQSWGGYQTAYVITRTDLFACAMAGAPVANMTSAYGGIRWGTGISRMWQYEHSQSRLGATLWEKPLLYLENSPLFQADKVNTPLLMMHNDKDGAVPWYQGIEFYTALRRLNRPVWMLTYNGEDHNLIERKNRKDLTVRMMQFFDYYLKFAPMPYWMRNGVPALEKGIKMRYETESER